MFGRKRDIRAVGYGRPKEINYPGSWTKSDAWHGQVCFDYSGQGGGSLDQYLPSTWIYQPVTSPTVRPSAYTKLATSEVWPSFHGKRRHRLLMILRQVRLRLQANAEI